MFNTIKVVSLGALCLVFASSCKKDVVENPNGTQPNTEKDSISSNAEDSYFPYNNGSAYTYVDSTTGGSSTVTRSAVAILGDTSIDGKTFSKTSSAGSKALNYYNSADGVTTLVSYNGKDKQTTTVLKANAPIGTTWKDEFSNNGVATTYDWKIVNKGISRTVQGVTYDNVIQVNMTGSAVVRNKGKIVFSNSDYYYAPNVGLIENVSYDPATGQMQLHRELQKSSK